MSLFPVLGIDPSMRNWGFALANIDTDNGNILVHEVSLTSTEKGGAKSTRVNSDDLRRCQEVYASLVPLLSRAKVACVEIPVGSQSARAMASYGMCLGILATISMPLIQVTALEVKSQSGYKYASKEEMIEWAVDLYPSAGWRMKGGKPILTNEHPADAVGAIHAGVKTAEFRSALNLYRAMAISS